MTIAEFVKERRKKLGMTQVTLADRAGVGLCFVRDLEPEKDGRQTPMRGHPAFKAMHGSAMCCRGCMEKWWKVRKGRPLSAAQQRKAVDFLMAWIERKVGYVLLSIPRISRGQSPR